MPTSISLTKCPLFSLGLKWEMRTIGVIKCPSKGWFPYDRRRSQIAESSAIVCDHMDTLLRSPAILRSWSQTIADDQHIMESFSVVSSQNVIDISSEIYLQRKIWRLFRWFLFQNSINRTQPKWNMHLTDNSPYRICVCTSSGQRNYSFKTRLSGRSFSRNTPRLAM